MHMTVTYQGRTFDHGAHASRAGVTCTACHPAGQPSQVGGDCSGCHHKPRDKTCAACHPVPAGVFAGTGAAAGPGKPSPMASVTCEQCHKKPPAPMTDGGCAACHPAAFANVYNSWRKATRNNYRDLGLKIDEARANAGKLGGADGAEALRRAEADLSWVAADGSWGAHNNGYLNDVLKADIERLNAALAAPEQ
jgi:hypothetical protein